MTLCKGAVKTAGFFILLSVCYWANPAVAEDPIAKRSAAESLIRDQLNAWSLEDEKLFLSTVHPEIVFAYPGARLDKAGALRLFRYWSDNYSDTRVYFHNFIIEGNDFSVEYQFATTRDEDGARSASGTLTTGQIKDGKLLLWKEYLDGRVSKLQMEGDLPIDEGKTPFPWPPDPGPKP
jgi:hypothetical protein